MDSDFIGIHFYIFQNQRLYAILRQFYTLIEVLFIFAKNEKRYEFTYFLAGKRRAKIV